MLGNIILEKSWLGLFLLIVSLFVPGCTPPGSSKELTEAELAAARVRLVQGNALRKKIGLREIQDEWLMGYHHLGNYYFFYVGDTGYLKIITMGEGNLPITEVDNYYSENEYKSLEDGLLNEQLMINYNYQSKEIELNYNGDNAQAEQHMKPLQVPPAMLKQIPNQQKLQIADSVLKEMNMTRFQKYHNVEK